MSLLLLALLGCPGKDDPEPEPNPHGPIAEGITARLGEVVPYATAEQRRTFERGHAVALRRFDREDGLGPAFNVTFCGSCHEKPVTGGSGGLYRNFFLTGVRTADGAFFPGMSAGDAGGVIRLYYYGDDYDAHPEIPPETNVIAQRNPIPFFGVGLIAELEDDEILSRQDPYDIDGDGISGRPNYDRGFVGRFGRKAQTVSIEKFIRGPLFNHLGVTTDPLTEAQKAALPVDSSSGSGQGAMNWLTRRLVAVGQAAAPDGPLNDDDDAPDPEMSTKDLFDLVSFAMLLAAPEPEPLTDQTRHGRDVFDAVGCGGCHTPRLDGPRGPLHTYSDLLLHDMGPDLADGFNAAEATGSEFRTQPLWGLAAVGPYLHDGRASTIAEAIAWHGGEATRVRTRFEDRSEDDQRDLIAFLLSLGGRDQYSPGLVPLDAPIPAVGAYGGPTHRLSKQERADFLSGRTLFDTEFGYAEGVGSPRLNGDSCRACHFDPVVGGSGPRGVNVIRHGILNDRDQFVPPAAGTILHRTTTLFDSLNRPQPEANLFSMRQTPHLFGLGLIDDLDDSVILANADPADVDGDGISGKPSRTDAGKLGRFGWQAQVPSLDEFVRDAVGAELGMTLPYVEGLTFGRIQDNDDVPDPEMTAEQADAMTAYLRLLGPPPRQLDADATAIADGEALFATVGCDGCHIPALDNVPLFSDLLLHEILSPDLPGIEEASANRLELRTPPLWGLSQTAPYLHDGRADTIEQAIAGHAGEAEAVRQAWENLDAEDQRTLRTFLESL